MEKTAVIAAVLLGMVGVTLAGECLDLWGLYNQCPVFDTFCYNARKDFFNCPAGKHYHCAWSPGSEKYVEDCVEPVTCEIGKEPLIYSVQDDDGHWKPQVRCAWCRNPNFYNPRDVQSYEIDHCPQRKSDCISMNHMVQCDYENETDQFSSDVLCRCDVKNGYRIARSYDQNRSACMVYNGFNCMEAGCLQDEDLLIQGYLCAPKCPEGESRSDEKSDDCIPVSTAVPPTTHPSPLTSEVENNTTANPLSTNTTTTKSTPTAAKATLMPYTIKTDKSTTSITQDEGKDGLSDKSLLVFGIILGVGVVIVLLIVGVVVWFFKFHRNTQGADRQNAVPLTVPDGDGGGGPNGVVSPPSAELDRGEGLDGDDNANANRKAHVIHIHNPVYTGVYNQYGDKYNVSAKTANVSKNESRASPEASGSESEHENETSPLLSNEDTSYHEEGIGAQESSATARSTPCNSLGRNKKSRTTSRPGTATSSKTSLTMTDNDQNQIDGPTEHLYKASERFQERSRPFGFLRRMTSQSEPDVSQGNSSKMTSDGRSKSFSNSEKSVPILQHENLDLKTYKLMIEHAIDRCRVKMLEDMDPDEVIDAFHNEGVLTYIWRRDNSEKSSTTEKNRGILDAIRRSGKESYIKFKKCLKATKQDNCIQQLQELEKQFLKAKWTDTHPTDTATATCDERDLVGDDVRPTDGDSGISADSGLPAAGSTVQNSHHKREADAEKKAEESLRQLESCTTFEEFQQMARSMDPEIELPADVPSACNISASQEQVMKCPDGFRAYKTSGCFNSCLYESISILLFGDESHYLRLRLLAALYAAKNAAGFIQEMQHHLYGKTTVEVTMYFSSMMQSSTDSKGITTDQMIERCVQTIIIETATLGVDSCLMHVLFLCRALRRSIKSHYQTYQDDLLNTSIAGDNQDPLNIMWINSNNADSAPNHVVPLVKLEPLDQVVQA